MLRALLIEDSNTDAKLLLRSLRANWADVEPRRIEDECAMRDALATDQWDVILCDWALPKFGAIAALELLRASGLDIPFVIVSGTIGEEAAVQAMRDGASDYVKKNELGRLVAVVERELREGASRRRLREQREQHEHFVEEAHQALQASESRAKGHAALLAAVLESAPDVIQYVALDGAVRWTNRPGSEDSAAPADLGGRDWLSLSPSENREALRRAFDSVARTGQLVNLELAATDAGGRTTWSSRRFGPVRRDGQILGVVIITRDISEGKEAETRLLLADRMASIGTLASGVAHEINNPLSAVIAYLDLAVQDLANLPSPNPVPPDIVEELNEARAGADRVRIIVRDLKVFSRHEEESLGPVDVERVMESTLRMAWNEIRHRARLVKDYGRVPDVLANESRLGQVFLNLVVNAAQAIPEGRVSNNVIRIATSGDSSGRAVVSVTDSGGGIPPDVQRRLFTPFFTTKPAGSGTGLGLAICQRIVHAFGGEISFMSELGKGTTFSVHLPFAPAEDRAPRSAPTAGPTAAGPRGRILVVDDDVMTIKATKRSLESDHDVTTVDSGLRALDLLRRGEHYDLILCDLMMPHMTGMEFYDELLHTNERQAARVMFITGGAFTPRARAFLDAVPNPRIEKPFSVQNLRTAVSNLVR